MTEQSHPSFNDRSASSFDTVPLDTPHFRRHDSLIRVAFGSRERPFGVLLFVHHRHAEPARHPGEFRAGFLPKGHNSTKETSFQVSFIGFALRMTSGS